MSTHITGIRIPTRTIPTERLMAVLRQCLISALAHDRDERFTEAVLLEQYQQMISTGTAPAGEDLLSHAQLRFDEDLKAQFATEQNSAFHRVFGRHHLVVFNSWRLAHQSAQAVLQVLPEARDHSYHDSTDEQVCEIGYAAWRARRAYWDDALGQRGHLPDQCEKIVVDLTGCPDPKLLEPTESMMLVAAAQAITGSAQLGESDRGRLGSGNLFRYVNTLHRAVLREMDAGLLCLPRTSLTEAVSIHQDRRDAIAATVSDLAQRALQDVAG